jgi:hypothetical protein
MTGQIGGTARGCRSQETVTESGGCPRGVIDLIGESVRLGGRALDVNPLISGRTVPSPSTRWQFHTDDHSCQLIAPAGSSA